MYTGLSIFNIMPHTPVNDTQTFFKTDCKISRRMRLRLFQMENWYYLSVQLRWFAIGSVLNSLYSLLVAFLSIMSMEMFEFNIPSFFLDFAFECEEGKKSVWWIHKTAMSETLYELHIVIIFISCMITTVVTYSVPYYYDRILKTEKELELDQKKRKRKLKKKQKKEKKKRSSYHVCDESILKHGVDVPTRSHSNSLYAKYVSQAYKKSDNLLASAEKIEA